MHTTTKAIQVLREGGIVIFPTDTAFGIGCRIDALKSVDRLFKLRKRDRSHATPVLVDSISMALTYYSRVSNIVRHLMKTYWPGALTIIAPCQTDLVYSPIRGGKATVGLRMPNHETTLSLIRGVGVPVIGTSANFHGHRTPYTFDDIEPGFITQVDAVVPGTCIHKQPSTVIDCSVDPYVIVRYGAVTLPHLAKQHTTKQLDKDTILSLEIDTSASDTITVILRQGNKEYASLSHRIDMKAQMVLPLLDRLLHKHKKTLSDIRAVYVHTGPGSYTGLRVGASIAHMLSELLCIPINGKSPCSPLTLRYVSKRR